MTKQLQHEGNRNCATGANLGRRTEIAPQIDTARKDWQTAAHECQRKQDRLIRRLVKQRAAEDAEHQQAQGIEKELRRNLHRIRVRRARKRDSLHSLEKKLVARCLEIEVINKEEAVEEAALTEAQTRLQTIESRLEKQVRKELSGLGG